MKRIGNVRLAVALMLGLAALTCPSQSAIGNNDRDLAFELEQQGKNAESETAWRAVLKARPSDGEAYAHLGLLEARQERYKNAVPLYRRALALSPQMPGLRLNLGLALFKGGELKQAIQVFSPLRTGLAKDSPEARRITALLGLAYYGVGNYSTAVPYLKSAAIDDPQNLQFRLVLAHSCLSSRQFQCVLDTYHEILALNAESAEADMLAGEAMDEMHNSGGAIEQFRAAVKADPREPNVHFGLGYLLWTQNQFEEAAEQFHDELDNVPDNAQALAFLADSDMQTNRAAEAIPLIKKALQIDPKIGRAHLDLGILYASHGEVQDATRELKKAALLMPGDPSPHWRLARIYQATGDRTHANVEFQKTRDLHKAENETIARKLKAAQDRGKPTENAAEPLPPDPGSSPNN